jgi:hypothetical protein
MQRTLGALAVIALLCVVLPSDAIGRALKTYKDRTKAEWTAAPPDFLRLLQAPSPDLKFFRINDEVMGGKSSSSIAVSDSCLTFSGTINTTGGGFASCRTLGDSEPLGLTGSGLLVDAEGDGMLYKVTLHTADSWSFRAPSWSQDFVAGKRSSHKLFFRDFSAGWRGQKVEGQLDASTITGIGFSLSLYTSDGKPNPKFGPGPFKIEVHSVEEFA